MSQKLNGKIPFVRNYLSTLLLFTYMGTIGYLYQKNRILAHQLRNQFSFFKAPPRPRLLKTKALDIVVDTTKSVALTEPSYTQGNVTLYELLTLNLFVRTFKPRAIFEIGTFDGRTTLNMAMNAPSETKIYTLDLPKDEVNMATLTVSRGDQNLIDTNVTGSRFLRSNEESRGKITQLYGDTATFDFSPYFNSVDLIFIDGAHTYEYVKNDSEIALKLLRNGKGVILWHDYDSRHEGSIRAIEELQAAHPEWEAHHIEGTNMACVALR